VVGAASAGADGDLLIYLLPFLVVFVATFLIVKEAPTARQAWGRMALANGIACFALPFMALAFSAVLGAKIVPHNAAASTVAGVTLAGVAMVGAAGVFGFFAGMILIVVAYFTLKSRPSAVSA